jgi:hypothetical protein
VSIDQKAAAMRDGPALNRSKLSLCAFIEAFLNGNELGFAATRLARRPRAAITGSIARRDHEMRRS